MHVHPTRDQFRAVVERGIEGPVVMLNLIRFRDVADYTDHPDLAPDEPISGAEAYRRYGAAVTPMVAEVGGELVFDGTGGPWLIGPDGARWDHALLVRYPSLVAFGGMTSSDEYLAVMGHRDAAVADSRLLPLVPQAATN